ncbi:GntR family transcriptional regulator [Arcticibacter tournemirensis]|uniref:GntR family transcriptional regulator n=1 Tax=Arcticibacter tournemirensis TaxID=699437 RepID=A0A5M9GUR0_9SPHI|nr:GntR family transcriptional regulator [Arcticibacter tournemirensis]KAA8478442.1 GntR family transcriptional regulator [Arcticibacter tournemirensis]TQM48567.1 GntR family transcriptional regulator [Arcticibacter tournemirensis]
MILEINHESHTPLHKQAETLIRELINKPEYKNGKLLPNEVELSEQLKISRNTLRQAINTLVMEGLLVRKKGVGTRVENKRIFTGASNWLSFSEEMRILGIEIHNFELQIFRHEVSPEAAAFFNIKQGTKVMRLERLRGKKEHPFVYFTSEFNPQIPLSASENYNRPLYEILESDYGIIAQTSKEEISAAAADNFIASKLEIKHGVPILVRKRYVFDIYNNPIEYNVGCYRADSFTYTIESKRNV